MTNVLVTGANGQLGKCLQEASKAYPNLQFFFASRHELDMEDREAITLYFSENNIDYCINTAAYTHVEQAEKELEKAFSSNAEAVKHLAITCKAAGTTLLHISTDYVFDGKKSTPYVETDATNPLNIYGASKLKGEQYIEEIGANYFIFRTSWLYSTHGHNFLNTILKFAKDREEITITTEQTGTPTNANDLAKVLLQVIVSKNKHYGLYHYSNAGEATWYDFAAAILDYSHQNDAIKLAKTDHYPTFAARPKYSVLNTEKAEQILKFEMKSWKESLQTILNN
ncbi:dTDP-4-dehydrorhamnose reductase [Marixanthomonas spongiae]|uniref:dTDP-4-dehydrorhamnose reductase n=1 Tax=Marixanthomonas spongiae TaxID=2174845 RepID=A0A2U0I200_9FLAO|nr:dTDP-4-dehydrorhamnose reductase [Marixanthomonas spongiae]PVW15141.1 dTDP-4-dehydrorhamnose reductase [Marixanthomonas spongiae]